MSILFSSIVPHSPLLIDTIGKDNISLLSKTIASFRNISEQIKEKNIETILLISSHGDGQKNTFNISNSSNFVISFEDFGDFFSRKDMKGDTELADLIKSNIKSNLDVDIIDKPSLNNSIGIPLYLLGNANVDLKTVPIYCSGASLSDHYEFGKQIGKQLKRTKKNIMVLSSANLSHRLNEKSPVGYSSKGIKFDQKIIENIKNKNIDQIIDLNQDLLDEVGGNGVKSIIMMLGIISGEKYSPKLLAYEYPFGIGYLSMNFMLCT